MKGDHEQQITVSHMILVNHASGLPFRSYCNKYCNLIGYWQVSTCWTLVALGILCRVLRSSKSHRNLLNSVWLILSYSRMHMHSYSSCVIVSVSVCVLPEGMCYHGGPLVCYHKHLWSEWLFAHWHSGMYCSDGAISLQHDPVIRGISLIEMAFSIISV
jgi:hypothetical protein